MPFNAFNSVLGIGMQRKAPTYKQLYNGKWTHPLNGLPPASDNDE